MIVLAALLPFAVDSGGVFMQNCIQALAYTVMALGLNIVVGFAGLLDLGYVAFFAIGAYTAGMVRFGVLLPRRRRRGHGTSWSATSRPPSPESTSTSC